MSTLLYSHLTSQREQAPAGTSKAPAAAGADPNAGKPGIGTFVDAMAALVPAEVLAAHALLIGLGTTTIKVAGGKTQTKITEPTALKVLFVMLLLTSLALYVISHLQNWHPLDFVRMLLPPAAFVAWTMLQRATMFDAWAPSLKDVWRSGVGIVIALLVGALAAALASKADANAP